MVRFAGIIIDFLLINREAHMLPHLLAGVSLTQISKTFMLFNQFLYAADMPLHRIVPGFRICNEGTIILRTNGF